MSEIKRTGKSKGGGGRRMGINITLHKQVVFMTSLCSLYYNFSAKTLDGPRKYFCTEWRGLQNTAVSPRAGDSRGCWAGQREARVTRDT